MTEYTYFCLMRPPTPGAVPRDGLIDTSYQDGKSRRSGHHYYGVVTYNRPLTEDELWTFDLELAVTE